MKNNFPTLFSPFQIGKMKLKNRIVFPPMNTSYANENGAPTNQMIEYYGRRAKGGAGLITVEAVSIDAESRNHGGQPMMTTQNLVSAWGKLVEKVQRYGSKISIELVHFGSEGSLGKNVSASEVTSKGNRPVHSLTIEEIIEIEDKFANAAKLSKRAGFDAVTLHGTHGNLISQFLSPLYNKRVDCYGGSVYNRLRFLSEIVEKVRAAVGNHFPVILRLSADDYLKDGRKIEETLEMINEINKMSLDALDISAGLSISYLFSIAPASFPHMEGIMMPFAKAIKEKTHMPVIAVGGIRDALKAEELLQSGTCDLIALGRSLIADPEFPNKCYSNNEDEIRPCLSCQHCLDSLDNGAFLKCTVNAEAGREYEFSAIAPTPNKKNVLIIGGGVAGMEAARICAKRGHHVTIMEKQNRLGGTMIAAALPPNKQKMQSLINWYENELTELGVNIILNTECTPKLLNEYADYTILIATGASYARNISGSDSPNVITATEALTYPEKVGDKVVIIGGGASGCETAEFFGAIEYDFNIHYVNGFEGGFTFDKKKLKDKTNKDVTIVEMLDDIASDMDGQNHIMTKFYLKENDVKTLKNTKVVKIDGQDVHLLNIKNGKESTLKAETIILAGGLVSNKMNIDEACHIGDCNEPGKIADAVYKAYCAAMEV